MADRNSRHQGFWAVTQLSALIYFQFQFIIQFRDSKLSSPPGPWIRDDILKTGSSMCRSSAEHSPRPGPELRTLVGNNVPGKTMNSKNKLRCELGEGHKVCSLEELVNNSQDHLVSLRKWKTGDKIYCNVGSGLVTAGAKALWGLLRGARIRRRPWQRSL